MDYSIKPSGSYVFHCRRRFEKTVAGRAEQVLLYPELVSEMTDLAKRAFPEDTTPRPGPDYPFMDGFTRMRSDYRILAIYRTTESHSQMEGIGAKSDLLVAFSYRECIRSTSYSYHNSISDVFRMLPMEWFVGTANYARQLNADYPHVGRLLGSGTEDVKVSDSQDIVVELPDYDKTIYVDKGQELDLTNCERKALLEYVEEREGRYKLKGASDIKIFAAYEAAVWSSGCWSYNVSLNEYYPGMKIIYTYSISSDREFATLVEEKADSLGVVCDDPRAFIDSLVLYYNTEVSL